MYLLTIMEEKKVDPRKLVKAGWDNDVQFGQSECSLRKSSPFTT